MANLTKGMMLPVWGAYVVSAVALGATAYQAWLQPVAAKLRLEAAKIENETAKYEWGRSQIDLEIARKYEGIMVQLGYDAEKLRRYMEKQRESSTE